MGINLSNTSSRQEMLVLADTAITAGDLVCNAETGGASSFNAALGATYENNATAGPVVVKSATSFGVNTGIQTGAKASALCAELGNKNLVFFRRGNGTTADTGAYADIRTTKGDAVAVVTVCSDTTVQPHIRVKKLTASTFLCVWGSATASARYAIFNNDGTVVLAATTASFTVNAPSAGSFNVGVLVNGDFVLAYKKVTSNDTCFQRYNSSGVAQGAEVVVLAAGNNTQGTAVIPQSSGGFVVGFMNGTTAYKFGRYNASGVLQGSITTVVTTTNSSTWGFCENSYCELTNGNFVLQWLNTDNYPDLWIYNSSGTLVANVDLGVSAGTFKGAAIVPTSFGVTAALSQGPTTWFNEISFSGAASGNTSATLNFVNTDDGDYCQCLAIGNLGAGGYAIARLAVETVTNAAFWVGRTSRTGSPQGTPLNVSGNQGAVTMSGYCFFTADGLAVMQYCNSATQSSFAITQVQKKSILGVAMTTAAAGAVARVATQGVYPINQAIVTPAFDNRAATVPGSKGVVVGGSAVLAGMV